MKKMIIPVFIALAFIQWWVPARMIVKKETVLKKGDPYKFLTEPVDPSDPFKGKFVSLNFKADTFTLHVKNEYTNGQEVYVGLIKDNAGYASISSLDDKEPSGVSDFVKAKISYVDYEDSQLVHIQYSFEKFYLEEYKAPRAETLYRESNRDSKNRTYALVRIFKGDAVIEDVFINDTSIHRLIPH